MPSTPGNSCNVIVLALCVNTKTMWSFVIERGTVAATRADVWHAEFVGRGQVEMPLL